MIYESLGLPCIEFVADDNDADDYRVPSYFQRLFTLYSKYTKMFCTYHSLTIEISSRARLSRNSDLLSGEKKSRPRRAKKSPEESEVKVILSSGIYIVSDLSSIRQRSANATSGSSSILSKSLTKRTRGWTTCFFYVKWLARSTDARVFPEEILGEQARDRVKLVDSKENVQNEVTAAVYRQIYRRTEDKTPQRSYDNTKRDEAGRGKLSKKFPCSLLRLAGCE
ncbi:hypothetical protein ALC56_04324 [Trachymyrmex septentrionalis]|uniref:Uncharacterized protein n=1 Tax=Trachymyrmex septentrionalis TaxID=34720 RepID=A0A195FL82_9HYME|nr:hypothetical protein ALC56_04324 [Trachymyrmex septentrionalis]